MYPRPGLALPKQEEWMRWVRRCDFACLLLSPSLTVTTPFLSHLKVIRKGWQTSSQGMTDQPPPFFQPASQPASQPARQPDSQPKPNHAMESAGASFVLLTM